MAEDFFAGCVGGLFGVIASHPFDTIKVKIQTQNPAQPQYRGIWHCFTDILKKENVKGLYRGVTSPMAGVALVNAVVFGVYENLQREFNLQNSSDIRLHFYAGAFAGFAQSFVCAPMEMVKARLQVQNTGVYKGSMDCLRKVFKAEGFRGVFNGLGVTIVREVPAFGIYFSSYELMAGNEDTSTARMLLAGGTAGMLSWGTTYPQDVIKTRLQSDGTNGPRKYTGAIDCLTKSVKHEGLGVLYKGVNATLLRAFPANAVTFATVKWVLKILEPQEHVHHHNTEIIEKHPDKPQFSIQIKKNLHHLFHYYEERLEALQEMDIC